LSERTFAAGLPRVAEIADFLPNAAGAAFISVTTYLPAAKFSESHSTSGNARLLKRDLKEVLPDFLINEPRLSVNGCAAGAAR
jgi:hypothetical protein